MKDITFEKALEKLEKIVEDLESGDFPLETLMKKHEEGIKLSNVCREKLDMAKQKVEILTKKKNGLFAKKDFETENEQ